MSQIQVYSGSRGSVSGVVVNQVRSEIREEFTASTPIPFDDTIPQSSEGDQILSVTITPQKSSNILVIDFSGSYGSAASSGITSALFIGASTDSIAATSGSINSNGNVIRLFHYMSAGTTSSLTFKIRVGPTFSGDYAYFNGDMSGNRLFGGVAATLLTVTELEV